MFRKFNREMVRRSASAGRFSLYGNMKGFVLLWYSRVYADQKIMEKYQEVFSEQETF